MLGPDEIDAMLREDAMFAEQIAGLKDQIAALWRERAPVHAQLREYKRKERRRRMGPEMLEKIRKAGECAIAHRRY